jgi:hypothetical protein
LAVLTKTPAGLPLDLGSDVVVEYADRLDTPPQAIDVVILDAGAGNGWPIDNALAGAALCRGRCGVVVLCSSAADAKLVETRTASRDVVTVATEHLRPGDLQHLVKAMLARTRSKPRHRGG